MFSDRGQESITSDEGTTNPRDSWSNVRYLARGKTIRVCCISFFKREWNNWCRTFW